jgi:hypothetical protein
MTQIAYILQKAEMEREREKLSAQIANNRAQAAAQWGESIFMGILK